MLMMQRCWNLEFGSKMKKLWKLNLFCRQLFQPCDYCSCSITLWQSPAWEIAPTKSLSPNYGFEIRIWGYMISNSDDSIVSVSWQISQKIWIIWLGSKMIVQIKVVSEERVTNTHLNLTSLLDKVGTIYKYLSRWIFVAELFIATINSS